MKKFLAAAAVGLTLLSACAEPIDTYQDKFTGYTVTRTRDMCKYDYAVGRFCIGLERDEAANLGKITYTYKDDSWLFMHKAQVRFKDSKEVYTLFNVRHFDVTRDIRSSGIVERYIQTFPLSQAKNNMTGFARFTREYERRSKAGLSTACVIRVTGQDYYADWDC